MSTLAEWDLLVKDAPQAACRVSAGGYYDLDLNMGNTKI